MAAQSICPLWAASTPDRASSTTRQFFGDSFRRSQAFKNTSGSGLECVMFVPSETASKKCSSPICFKINYTLTCLSTEYFKANTSSFPHHYMQNSPVNFLTELLLCFIRESSLAYDFIIYET